MNPHHLLRHSRLEKQEEFELEEENFMLSPVTIQIEDRGENEVDDQNEEKYKDDMCVFDDDGSSDATGQESSNSDVAADSANSPTEHKSERKKTSSRVKLLVRSHAVHDDASPPPDLETIITNTNMLSVTNASSFSTQTQSKGASNKLRLGHQSSSQGSTESSSASGLSRDSSTETYTDSTGVDLQQFILDTLHKNQKDRLMLLKIEQELTTLIKDTKRQSLKFPQMSSYNRMLVHRVAAFFGLDHYVDSNGTAVIVNKTKTTRTPDSRFQDFIRDELLPEEPKKSILKRDSISFEEGKEQKSPERQSSTDSRRSKSFEEREEEYEKARARIFNQDEGLGESPLTRSQEGSSRRSSQEDIRWPSSEARPWSSTDSDSSGRPLGSKLGSSFENDASVQNGIKNAPFGALAKVDKSVLLPSRASRPTMTKASSFGGISVLSRENSTGKSTTPKITKAESFNVTTLSNSSASLVDDVSEPQEDHVKSSPSPKNLVPLSVANHTFDSNQLLVALGTSEQTFPSIAGQPIESCSTQASSQQTSGRPLGNQESPSAADLTVGQPLMWPYSANTDVLFPGSVLVSQPTGCQRMAFSPYQPLAVPASNQVPSAAGHVSAVTTVTPSIHPSAQRQVHALQPQQTVNTTSPPAVFYIPYVSQIQSSVTHQPAATPVQNVSRQPLQAQPSQFLNEPRPLVLFPGCYMHHTSNAHPMRYVFSTNTAQQCTQGSAQSTGVPAQSVADMKSLQPNSNVLNSQYLSAYPAIAFSHSGEASTSATTTVTVTTAIYPYTNIVMGSACQNTFNSQHSSQDSQPPVCLPQSVATPVTLPPVYVSITSSTQSPATQTHAGGHIAAQFTSFRSQSFPLASNSNSGNLSRQSNSGMPLHGYTVYTTATGQSPITTVTLNQSTPPTSQFSPVYASTLQVLQPSVPMLGNSSLQSPGVLRFPTALSAINKVPLSFPLVKQASDPGVGDCLSLSNYLCLVGHPVQHQLAHLLLPQQLSMSRFPRASITSFAPSSRPPKTRKQRSKASANNSSSSSNSSSSVGTLSMPNTSSIFDIEDDRVVEIEGLPESMKLCEVERCLEVTEVGAKVYFVNADNMLILSDSSDTILNKHTVLAVFDSDTAAQSALLNLKSTKFQLRRWHRSREERQVSRTSS